MNVAGGPSPRVESRTPFAFYVLSQNPIPLPQGNSSEHALSIMRSRLHPLILLLVPFHLSFHRTARRLCSRARLSMNPQVLRAEAGAAALLLPVGRTAKNSRLPRARRSTNHAIAISIPHSLRHLTVFSRHRCGSVVFMLLLLTLCQDLLCSCSCCVSLLLALPKVH